MVNYIRAEFYKVFRRRYTWITLVVLLALEALMVAGWMFTNSHGNHVDFYTGAGMLCVMVPDVVPYGPELSPYVDVCLGSLHELEQAIFGKE